MKRLALGIASLAAVAAFAPAAYATDFTPASPNFSVSGNIASGPVTAGISNSGIAAGAFVDRFLFTIDQTGVGSGSLSTSTTQLFSSTDLDITSVLINGMAATKTVSGSGLSEFFTIESVPIISGVMNTIQITGTSRGNGSYGGQATFTPAVPEPATWGMMILGFGMIGGATRYSRRKTKVSFA